MAEKLDQPVKARAWRWRRRLSRVAIVMLGLVVLALAAGFLYVKSRPLVFNESFNGHRYCINMVHMALTFYADDHGGAFPVHTNGYGDALLLMWEAVAEQPNFLTAPGFDDGRVFAEARASGGDVDESRCGRVYVQGLKSDSPGRLAIVFDKQPTPGGDHCHGLRRLSVPMGREVLLVSGKEFVLEPQWPTFVKEQVELLVEAGIPRDRAEAFYNEKPAPIRPMTNAEAWSKLLAAIHYIACDWMYKLTPASLR